MTKKDIDKLVMLWDMEIKCFTSEMPPRKSLKNHFDYKVQRHEMLEGYKIERDKKRVMLIFCDGKKEVIKYIDWNEED